MGSKNTKERRTVSLPPEIDAYLDEGGTNASELVAELVEKHMNCGASQNEILEYRIEQVRSDLDELRGRVESKEEELDELLTRRENLQQRNHKERESKLDKAKDALKGVPRKPDNPAIQNWAGKLDLEPTELIEELDNE